MAEKFGSKHLRDVVDACKRVRVQMECFYENHDKLRERDQHVALAKRLDVIEEHARSRALMLDDSCVRLSHADLVCLSLLAELLVLQHKCLMLSEGASVSDPNHLELAVRCAMVDDLALRAVALRDLDDVERAVAEEIASRAPEMPSAEPMVATVAEPAQVHLEPTSGDSGTTDAASDESVNRPVEKVKREKRVKPARE